MRLFPYKKGVNNIYASRCNFTRQIPQITTRLLASQPHYFDMISESQQFYIHDFE